MKQVVTFKMFQKKSSTNGV